MKKIIQIIYSGRTGSLYGLTEDGVLCIWISDTDEKDSPGHWGTLINHTPMNTDKELREKWKDFLAHNHYNPASYEIIDTGKIADWWLSRIADERLALLEAGLKEVGEDEEITETYDGRFHEEMYGRLVERSRICRWFTTQIEKLTEKQ